MKEKLLIDVKSEYRAPGDPDEDADVMYGIKFSPSNNTDDAFPKEDEAIDPDTINTLSCSTILFAACVSCNGTMRTCVTFVLEVNPASRCQRQGKGLAC